MDAFFGGHEHMQNYAQVPTDNENSEFKPFGADTNCSQSTEWFPQNGTEVDTRNMTFIKGEHYHQFTSGAAGRFPADPICYDHYSQGKFFYSENKYPGFALVHATPEFFKVTYKGSDENGKAITIFEVNITNDEAQIDDVKLI